MALNPNEIHIGPANIYIGVTAPATGAPPTWMTHTNGVPGTGTHVGATIDETVFTWTTEKEDLMAEQVMGVLDMYITGQGGELTFTAQERTLELMQKTFDNIGMVDDVTRMGFYGGGGGSIIQVQYTCIFLSSLRRDLVGKYEILVLYKGVSTEPMPLTYSRTSPSTYECAFRALPDTDRDEGDQIFQFSREK